MLFADLKYICATFLFSFQFFGFPLGNLEAGSMTRYFKIALFNVLSTKGKNSLSCFFSTFNVQVNYFFYCNISMRAHIESVVVCKPYHLYWVVVM